MSLRLNQTLLPSALLSRKGVVPAAVAALAGRRTKNRCSKSAETAGRAGRQPVDAVTKHGFVLAEQYERIRTFKEKYHHVIKLRADEESNQELLATIRSLASVELQTRFVADDNRGVSRIAVWSYEPLDEKLDALAGLSGAAIIDVWKD